MWNFYLEGDSNDDFVRESTVLAFQKLIKLLTMRSCVLQLTVCREQVEWAKQEKRTFLRQRIEARLANLYLETKEFSDALSLVDCACANPNPSRQAATNGTVNLFFIT